MWGAGEGGGRVVNVRGVRGGAEGGKEEEGCMERCVLLKGGDLCIHIRVAYLIVRDKWMF